MSRPRQLPNLVKYLRAKAGGKPSLSKADGFSCLASMGLSIVTTCLVYLYFGLSTALIAAIPVSALISMLLAGAIRMVTKPKNVDQARLLALGKAFQDLSERSRTGGLRRVLDPYGAAILEFASKQALRIGKCASDAAWSNEQLGSHWEEAKTKAEKSVDQAVEDLVLMMIDRPHEQLSRNDWFYLYETCLDCLDDPNQQPTTLIPEEYAEAAETARKTERLAEELEAALKKLKESDILRRNLAQPSSIDGALEELRLLQKAESELDEDHLRMENR